MSTMLSMKPNQVKSRHRNRRGAIVPFVAILLPILLIMAGFAINIAWLELTRTELTTAADAAARAANREYRRGLNQAAAISRGTTAASLNLVANEPLQMQASDFVFGVATRGSLSSRYSFAASGAAPNAVQATARRDAAAASGSLRLLMPTFTSTSTANTQQTAQATQVDVDVVVVLDRSGSMAYSASEPTAWPTLPLAAPVGWKFGDPAPPKSRWLDAVTAVNTFMTKLQTSPSNELISLVTYNSAASTDVPLTSNYKMISPAMDVYTNVFNSGGTNIGGGIEEGFNALRGGRTWAVKILIVMTDGIQNYGTDPVTSAKAAANTGIQIYTITFSSEADQALMDQVAKIGSGQHFHAADAAALTNAFQVIADSLPSLITN